jgi:hypothetical protein
VLQATPSLSQFACVSIEEFALLICELLAQSHSLFDYQLADPSCFLSMRNCYFVFVQLRQNRTQLQAKSALVPVLGDGVGQHRVWLLVVEKG